MRNEEVLERGMVIVLASPRGGGKTHLARRLEAIDSAFVIARGVVTRPPRGIEDNNDLFVSVDQFWAMEHALCLVTTVDGHHYGYLADEVRRDVSAGKKVIVPLLHHTDVVSSYRIWPRALRVYLRPELAELRQRLEKRAAGRGRSVADEDIASATAVIEQLNRLEWDITIEGHSTDDPAGALLEQLGARR